MTVPVLPLLLLALLLIGVGLGVFFYLRKKSAGADEERPVSQGLPVDLVTPFRAVKKDLSPALRFGPGVLALGDDGWKASRVLERLSGGSPATPAGDGSQLRTYRGKDAIVLELSDALVQNEADVVLSALSRLGSELPSGVVIVCLAVDYRSLASGTSQHWTRWAKVLQKRLPLFTKAGRSLGIRLCVTGFESEPGYEILRALWLSRRSSALSFLEVEQKSELQKFMGQVSDQLGVVLSARPQEFESVTRLAVALPDALHTLSELTLPLSESLARYTQAELNGVYLTDASGAAIPPRPFGFRPLDVAVSRARHERTVFVRQALYAAAVCGVLVLGLLMCGLWVTKVADKVQIYAESPGPQLDVPVETAQRGVRAAESLARLRFWPLPYAFSPQRREQGRLFVDVTRSLYVKPALEPERSLMRRVFAACLGRASSDNDFGKLVFDHRQNFEDTLEIPSQTLTALLRLGKAPSVPTELPSLTQAAGSLAAWRSLVLSIVSAMEEGIFEPQHLEELRAEAFLAELPKDAESVRVLQRAVRLLAAHADSDQQDEVRAARQIHAELEFLVENLSALSILRDWFRKTPSLSRLREPKSLAELLELTIARPVDTKPVSVVGPTEVTINLVPPVTIEQASFERALVRTRASVLIERFMRSRRQGTYKMPHESACGTERSVDPAGSSFFPPLTSSWGEGQGKAKELDALDGLNVRGPHSRGYGPTVTLPGWFTRTAVQRFVLPVINAITSDVDVSAMTSDALFTLRGFVDEELSAYAENYGRELSCYFQSFKFQPANLPLAESAVRELAAEGSWFERFLTVVAEQTKLPAEALANTSLAGAAASFSPLANAVEGKAIKDYFALLLAALPAASTQSSAPASPPAQDANAPRKFIIERDERLNNAMATLASTNTRSAAVGDVMNWLQEQNITGNQQRPFLLPLESLRSTATSEIRTRWQRELVTPAANLLRKYPFRSDNAALGGAITVSELEAEFGVDGRFWAVVLDTFSALVEAEPGRDASERNHWTIRPGLSAPRGMLELLHAVEQLTTALWAPDGKRRKLKLRLTPYELPVSRHGNPVIALAYLTVPGAEAQSFNQALEARTLGVEWWSAEESTLSVELLDSYASEVESFSTIVQKQGLWSFLRLMDAGRLEGNILTFYPQGEMRKTSKVEFELHSDIRALFAEIALAADSTREGKI